MKHAFSLVELSIVLVILGLLTGGILSGQSLIRAAEIRSTITETQKYLSAIHSFRDKYFALPGDMNNATKFWGAQAGAPGNCKTVGSSGSATCDGNGDGSLLDQATTDEQLRAWQHLASAGLIEGSFNGIYTMPGYLYVTNVNTPASKMARGGWFLQTYGAMGNNSTFSGTWANTLSFSDVNVPYTLLRPEEAWNIDTKLDDGKPGTGKAQGYKGDASAPCSSVANTATSATADAAATYNLANTGKICFMDFVRSY
ncbi:MAG: hypothetical protein DI582_08665 [Azospirillum brasilense]|nr:MAG: hypothetical protein DI582_08665 [Azospirillum brasilense]